MSRSSLLASIFNNISLSPKYQIRHKTRYLRPRSTKIKHTHEKQTPSISTPNTDSKKLIPPTTIFSNKDLLVVNKPAGWHSIPIPSGENEKCILQYLRSEEPTKNQHIRPMHRLDQPCTGVLLFAKKANTAKRIAEAWRGQDVTKEYLCIVERRGDTELDVTTKGEMVNLEGILWDKGNSVTAIPLNPHVRNYTSSQRGKAKHGRRCELEYRVLRDKIQPHNRDNKKKRRSSSSRRRTFSLLQVTSRTGARHQIRVMLAHLLNCPVVGDLRYGGVDFRNGIIMNQRGSLPDRSVALHARRLFLPTVNFGGEMTNEFQKGFVAPIPETWSRFFGLKDEYVSKLEGR